MLEEERADKEDAITRMIELASGNKHSKNFYSYEYNELVVIKRKWKEFN